MSKFDPLVSWLGRQNKDEASLSFAEIEGLLHAPLADSARKYPAFWSSGNHIGRLVAQIGWRARLNAQREMVTFLRDSMRNVTTQIASASLGASPNNRHAAARKLEQPADVPDFVLIGCVKEKRPGRHPAKDLYASALFKGRRVQAERAKQGWYILSAKHGLVAPDELIDDYDVTLKDLSSSERRQWSQNVLRDLSAREGNLRGAHVEIHAGAEYRNFGLIQGLEQRGARVTSPVEHLALGQQLAWYGQRERQVVPIAPKSGNDHKIHLATADPDYVRKIVGQITRDFTDGKLQLQGRDVGSMPGWDALPECRFARALREKGADDATVRVGLTLVAALDRARDADRLWDAAARMYAADPWTFDAEAIGRHSLYDLREVLAKHSVSQRHTTDTAAWRLLGEALADDGANHVVANTVRIGSGDAAVLRVALASETEAGQPRFPYLSGPKVSEMWLRLLVVPGGASLTNIDTVKVAVDVQVKRVTENLGIAQTSGFEVDAVRGLIQDAWQSGVSSAMGPAALAGTAAAVDPAVWYFGKWGCTFCKERRVRGPIGSACQSCRYDPEPDE